MTATPTTEPGFWLGLVLLQTLFTREHNAVCDALRDAYPEWGDEEVFQRARLIVAALIAKIHTVEWTPAVISHPTMITGMRANWWGIAGERLSRVFGRISDSEVVSGIPGAATHHYGVPYSLTEEFTAVYRMHPLTPDYFSMRSVEDDHSLRDRDVTLREMSGTGALDVLGSVSMSDLLYSFGTQHPGVVTLHNFPKFLQEFVRPDGAVTDLAATDILRHRELGVPRYCEFRRQLGLRAPDELHRARAGRRDRGRDGTHLPRRHREARSHGGSVRGTAAEGFRLQRHGIPHLHRDGIATAQQRPVPHLGLHPGGLHPDGHAVDRR